MVDYYKTTLCIITDIWLYWIGLENWTGCEVNKVSTNNEACTILALYIVIIYRVLGYSNGCTTLSLFIVITYRVFGYSKRVHNPLTVHCITHTGWLKKNLTQNEINITNTSDNNVSIKYTYTDRQNCFLSRTKTITCFHCSVQKIWLFM